MAKPLKDYKKIARDLKKAGFLEIDLRKKLSRKDKSRVSRLARIHFYSKTIKADKPDLGKPLNKSGEAFLIKIPENTRAVYDLIGYRTQKTNKGIYAEIPNNKKYTGCRATKHGFTMTGAGITVKVWFMPPHLAQQLIEANLPAQAPHRTAWCAKIGTNSASLAQAFAVRAMYLKWLFTASKSNDDAPINYNPVYQHCEVTFKF